MNGPVILDRRRLLAGGGALIVSFSLGDAFAQDQTRRAAGAEAARQPEGCAVPRFLDPHRCRRQHHRLHRQGRTRPGLQDRVPADRGRGARRPLRVAQDRHRRYQPHRQRRLYLRQQFDEGQRHRDPACRRAGARVADRGSRAAARTAGRNAQDRGRRGDRARRPALRLWRTGRGRHAACAGAAEIEAEGSGQLSRSWASRCSASIFRPRSPAARPMCRTCGCPAWCMRASCGRRATARIDRVRHRRGREDARRGQGRARRQFPRRGRREGIPGGQGDARAGGGREMAGEREPAEAGRSAERADQPAVAGHDHLPAEQSGRSRRARPSRQPIRGPIRRTARSGRPAPWRNRSTAP